MSSLHDRPAVFISFAVRVPAGQKIQIHRLVNVRGFEEHLLKYPIILDNIHGILEKEFVLRIYYVSAIAVPNIITRITTVETKTEEIETEVYRR